MSDTRRRFDDLREKLTKLDEGLIELLDARARLAKEALALREESALPTAPNLPSLADTALSKTTGDMPEGDLRRIVSDIHAACSTLATPARVVFSGSIGGPAHASARRLFGVTCSAQPKETAALAIDDVVRKRAELAVVPLESSDDGPLGGTVLALSETDLKISQIIEQSTELHAWRSARGGAASRRKIFAARTDIELASRYVAASIAEGLEVIPCASSVEACRAAASDETAVAVALDPFGSDAELVVDRTSIGDLPGGRTRYAVIGPRPHVRTGQDATALVFTVRDAPGSLLDVLKQFAERDINLTNIYSRPMSGEAWTYLFFVEISGHFTDRAVVTACEDVKKMTTMFKIVGAYPAA